MTNTRHIPDLEAAQECVRQAIDAARHKRNGTVDQCVTAALQYLQPDVEHVKDDTKPQPLYRVNVSQAGDGELGPTSSAPMDAADADALVRTITKAVNAQDGVVTVPLPGDRLPVHLAAVHIAAWWVTVHHDKSS